MRELAAISCFIALTAMSPSDTRASELRISEVSSLTGIRDVAPLTVVFSDHQDDELADPTTGLIPFDEWAQAMSLQKRLLSPYPDFTQKLLPVGPEGAKKTLPEKLHMYVAEARFTVPKPPRAIDLAGYVSIAFLERIDPAIKHRALAPAEADDSQNRNPQRRWCEGQAGALCITSRYQLEGKLPMGIQLVNQLTSRKKIADYLEFQSELRVLPPAELDQAALAKLTALDAPVTGALEQTIFHVNQIMQFGKFLAVLQQDPADTERTVATAFIALALKTRLLENQKKYEKVPVLRNLVPAQVLAGKSTFNTGSSISAGLPLYARNNIKAVAGILAQR